MKTKIIMDSFDSDEKQKAHQLLEGEGVEFVKRLALKLLQIGTFESVDAMQDVEMVTTVKITNKAVNKGDTEDFDDGLEAHFKVLFSEKTVVVAKDISYNNSGNLTHTELKHGKDIICDMSNADIAL